MDSVVFSIGAFFMLLSSLAIAADQSFKTVEIFTDNPRVVKLLAEEKIKHNQYRLLVHEINQVKQWENQFSRGLASDEEIARMQVQRRIDAMGGSNILQQQVMDAYAPLLRSIELGLLEFPAVVIDERFVIYGIDDSATAIKRFEQWQLSQ